MVYHKQTQPILTVLITMMVLSCGKEPVKKLQGQTTVSQLAKQILFNSREIQNYQAPLMYFQTVNEDLLTGEKTVLKGLSHIYQGEVYEVAAQMLSRMQLDLYYKSTDPEHGAKFPINMVLDDINDELTFWMGVDVYRVYGKKEGKSVLSSTPEDPLYNIKHKVMNAFSIHSDHYTDQTFLAIGGKLEELYKPFSIFGKILESERLFKEQEYERVLTFLDDEELYYNDIFDSNKQVDYYSPAVFKLAALAHYKLGINSLENALQKSFSTVDSIGYKIIAIMNLGEKYYYFEDSEKLLALWDNYEQFLVTQGSTVQVLVETNKRMPYCLDWIRFEDAILNVLKIQFPKELTLLDDSSDLSLETMKKFIKNPNDIDVYKDIHYVLLDFIKNPNRMDNYPTLVSGFIKELNQSPLSFIEKKHIQEVTESLVFNVKHSKASWQRNRPAFLLSLYGTLRWHGGRLPDCNGFLIDMRNMDERLSAVQEIASLFTQELIKY